MTTRKTQSLFNHIKIDGEIINLTRCIGKTRDENYFYSIDVPSTAVISDHNKILHYENDHLHRVDGPAMIYITEQQTHFYWYINGKEITDVVKEWMQENDLPDYTEWTDEHIIMFKLRFA